jgi:hypothetical protein
VHWYMDEKINFDDLMHSGESIRGVVEYSRLALSWK